MTRDHTHAYANNPLSAILPSFFSIYPLFVIVLQIAISLPPELPFPYSPTAPDDYVAVLNEMVMFGPSDETQIVQVMVNNDSIAEAIEMFFGSLSLTAGSSGVAISGGDATATITDTNG